MKKPAGTSRLFVRILIPLFLLSLFLTGLIFVFAYQTKKNLISNESERLATVSELKSKYVDSWINERKITGKKLQRDTMLIDMIKQLAFSPDNIALSDEIRLWVAQVILEKDHCGLFLLAPNGDLFFSYINEKRPFEKNLTRYLNKISNYPDSIFTSNLYYNSISKHHHLDVFVPLRINNDVVVTALLTFNADASIFPYLRLMQPENLTVETILVLFEDQDLLTLSLPYFSDLPVLEKLDPKQHSEAAEIKAARGQTGIIKSKDYRNQDVLAFATLLPGQDWIMLNKVNMTKVLEPLNNHLTIYVVAALLIIVTIGWVLTVAWKQQETRNLKTQIIHEKEKRLIHQQYDYLSRFANDIILLISSSGQILFANHKALSVYGYSEEEFRNLNIAQLRATDKREEIMDQLYKIPEGEGAIFETIHVTKTGHRFPVEVSTRRMIVEDTTCFQGIIRDITERKRAEWEIMEREQKLSITLNSIGDAVITTDTNGKVTRMNRVAEQLMGCTFSDVEGKQIHEFFHIRNAITHQPAEIPVDRVLKEGKIVGMANHTELLSLDGKIYQISDSAAPISGNQGNNLGVVMVFRDVTEQYQKDAAIRTSETRFRTLFEKANDGIFVLKDGVIVDCNPKTEQMLGYSRDELLFRGPEVFSPLLQPDGNRSDEKARYLIKTALESNEQLFYWQHQRKDGTLMDMEINLNVMHIEGESYAQAILRDISEQKKYERELVESKRITETLISNLQGIVYRCVNDENWTMLLLSDGFKKLTGFEPGDFIGSNAKNYSELIHPDDRQIVWKTVQEKIAADQHYEIEFRLRNIEGNYIDVWEKGKGIRSSEGEVVFLEGFITDITQRKKEDKLRQVLVNISSAVIYTHDLSELISVVRKELSKVVDTTNFFIATYNSDRKTFALPFMQDQKDHFTEFPVGKTITGYLVSQGNALILNKKQIYDLADQGLIEFHGTVCESWLGVPLNYENQIRGALVVQSYSSDKIYNEEDKAILTYVSNHVAIALQRKLYEDNLRIAKEKAEESERLKTAFLANMSHEIRTPMNAIIGFSDLLTDPTMTNEEKEGFIRIIHNNGAILLQLIDDIVDMAKIESGQLKIERLTCKPMVILKELYNHFEKYRNSIEKHELRLILDSPVGEDDLTIITDPLRLRQIISNLLSNAIKFTEKGTIAFGYQRVWLNRANGREYVRFYVSDTGIGIHPDKLDLIFERFRQADDSHSREFGGAGLGLAISKNIALLVGGDLTVESSPAKGTTFWLDLPLTNI